MRFFPILTALLTVAILFMLVFQREMVRDFFGNAPEAAADTQEETPPASDGTAPAGVSVVALKSTAEQIDTAVVVRGQTEALREVVLKAETSGRVIAAPFAKGSRVEAGDVLCELDPGTRDIALSQARAQLAEAEQNLAAAQKLSEGGFASETRLLSARTAFESAQSGVQQAERALEDLKITAPFAGLLDGDPAEVGSLLQPGAACAAIVELNPIKLVGYVAEVDVDRVEIGAQVGARLATGTQVLGTISYVGRSADPLTRTFRVEAEVDNSDLSIRDGQTAEILIAAQGRTAHLLPQSALTLNDAGLIGVRVVGDGDVARFVPIDLVRHTQDGVWLAGLDDEVSVLVVGQEYVTDGVALDVTYKEPGL